MNPELKKIYYTERDGLGLPQRFKGISFYPLRIIDFEYLPLFYEIFACSKKTLDVTKMEFSQKREIYEMTYFKFLLNLEAYRNNGTEFNVITKNLKLLLSFVTKIDIEYIKVIKIDIAENVYSLQLHIKNIVFDETDFDNIREIVLQQNGLSIENVEDFNPELEPYLQHHNRFSDNYDLNDQILFYASKLHKTVDEIKNCTIYQMKNQTKILQDIQSYEMNVIDLTMVGKEYKLPKIFEHIVVPGRYDSILEDVDKFKTNTSYEINQ